MTARFLPLAALLVLLTGGSFHPAAANPPRGITSAMLDDGTLPNVGEDVAGRVIWLEDGEHFLLICGAQIVIVHALTGRTVPHDGSLPEIDELGRGGPLPGGTLAPIKGPRELVTTNASKTFLAFVRQGNLHIEEIATKKERALTADGSEMILNGKAGWVYMEELFNRKRQAYWWSPDGSHLVFLRTDESAVPRAAVLDHTRIQPLLEITPYPRAGDPNPQVKLGIAPVKNGLVRWVDLGEYAKESFLITRVGWQPDSKAVWFCVQNRTQTWLDFCRVDRDGGQPRRLLRDTTKAWVNPPAAPLFFKDGSFLLTSERTGWRHLYHFDSSGKLKGPITRGEWEVRSVQKLDEKEGWVYFSGTRDSPTASNFYRIKLDGTGLEKLTRGKGTNEVFLNPRGDLFVAVYSDPQTPPQLRLHRNDGTLLQTDFHPVPFPAALQLGRYERVQIPTPDGFQLEASIHKPADFDPKKKYPVWFITYGGPQSPTVRDGFGLSRTRDEALANMGFIVFRCDPRSASGKGAVSAWTAYKQLGVQELKDIETAIKWLTAHPWADATRVGMSGHSYGGFLTAYALTHSKLFAAGVAASPVTDWHNYDSIYTERYMGTPQENPKGYEASSVVRAAGNLHGKLLLIHGVKDDNVHVQNTLQLVHALQQAGKDFELMLYPQARHGLTGMHYQRQTREFMKRILQPHK